MNRRPTIYTHLLLPFVAAVVLLVVMAVTAK